MFCLVLLYFGCLLTLSSLETTVEGLLYRGLHCWNLDACCPIKYLGPDATLNLYLYRLG